MAESNATVAYLRQRWWIPKCRQRVKSIVGKCVACRRLQGTAFSNPPAPPLPSDRVKESRPFAVTGVDYAGPLKIRTGKESADRYIALFTCAATRAVHLEVARDASAEAFMQVFHRFVSRRAYPKIMISDNGTNFVGAARILEEWQSHIPLQRHLREKSCQWRFIPIRAPWFGGFYERLIGMTKTSLRRALGKAMVSDEELQTMMCRVEAHLNDRPLTYVSDQINDEPALTPSMMIQGFRYDSIPSPIAEPEEDEDPSVNEHAVLTKRERHLQTVLQNFWIRWKKEYLLMLKNPPQRNAPLHVPATGDVVLIHDEGPRLHWKLGTIINLRTSVDNHVRSAEVRTQNGTLRRPVTKLYPLEVHSSWTQNAGQTKRSDEAQAVMSLEPDSSVSLQSPDPSGSSTTAEPQLARPTRVAAAAARAKIAALAADPPDDESQDSLPGRSLFSGGMC